MPFESKDIRIETEPKFENVVWNILNMMPLALANGNYEGWINLVETYHMCMSSRIENDGEVKKKIENLEEDYREQKESLEIDMEKKYTDQTQFNLLLFKLDMEFARKKLNMIIQFADTQNMLWKKSMIGSDYGQDIAEIEDDKKD